MFYNQLVRDTCHHKVLGVTDEMDVATMKEYMQVRHTASSTRLDEYIYRVVCV